MVCSHGNGGRVKEWLEKFIIMEDIHINDVTLSYSMLTIIGPQAESFMFDILKIKSLKSNSSISYSNEKESCFIYHDEQWTIPAYNVITKAGKASLLLSECAEKISLIGVDTSEILRIEQGIPKYNVDFSEQINPLEAGFEKFISSLKGCYIGQEVIARLDTYKKLQKKLTGFIFEDTNLHHISSGKVFQNNIEVGWITSQTWSFNLKRLIALGFLKTSITESEFIIDTGNGRFKVHCHWLPFLSDVN